MSAALRSDLRTSVHGTEREVDLINALRDLVKAAKPFALLDLRAPDPITRFDEESPVYVRLPSLKSNVQPTAKMTVGDVQRLRAALAALPPEVSS